MSKELRLYELPNHISMCKSMLEDDDLSQEEYDDLVSLTMATIEDEAQYYIQMISTDGHHIDMIENEIKRLREIKRIRENRIDNKKNFIKEVMTKSGIKVMETPFGKFSFRKSESIQITDVEGLPIEFVQVTVDKKPIKKDIKKYLKDNDLSEIEGAKLVVSNNLQIK